MATKKKGGQAGTQKLKSQTDEIKSAKFRSKAESTSVAVLKPPVKAKESTIKANGQSKSGAMKDSANNQKGKEKKNPVVTTISDLFTFIKEVDAERRKISWPERSQVIRQTISVLVLVTIITMLVLAFDWMVGHFIFTPLEHWARVLGGGIGKQQ
jgi:preprotein translocase subunit SecE